MTTSVREAMTSATAIRPNVEPDSLLSRTPSTSTVHGWSIMGTAPGSWMSDNDAEARKSEVIDRVYRLSWDLPGSGTGNVNSILIGPDLGVFPPEIMDFTEEIRNGWLTPYNMASWSVLYAVGADSSASPPKIVDFVALAGDLHPDLRDALHDLDQAKDEAREEGFPVPSDTALRNTRRLLHAMYRILPRRFEIYPMPDGEIAIDVPGGPGRSVLLLCGSDGGALCSVNMDGAHRRARYSDTRGLPDGFVRDALAELERPDSVAA